MCQLGRIELRCPAGVIKIEKALWGRTEGSDVCPFPCIGTAKCLEVRFTCAVA